MRFMLPLFLVACGGAEAPTEAQDENNTPTHEEAAVEEAASEATDAEEAPVAPIDSAWPAATNGIPEMDESNSVTTESGLQIITFTEGDGPQPNRGDLVSVHYHGWLASNGNTFDSSGKRGEPISFPVGVGMVIPGWDEGIAAMKVGTKARLRIPSNIAYGERAMGTDIPANSDLVFDVWLTGTFAAPTDGIPEIDESGARTTESGLKIITISEGTGDIVGDKVASVHYAGWLTADGKLFDTSVSRGRPFQFPVGAGRVIPGWDEGVAQMKVGERARLVIPWNLAYGESGRGAIPARADLTFDVWVTGAMAMPSMPGMR